MKRLISILLIFTLLFSLTACTDKQPEGTLSPLDTSTAEAEATTAEELTTEIPTTEEPATAEPVTEPASDEESATSNVDISVIGSIIDRVYKNTHFGISCTLNHDWTIATKEEIAQISGLTTDLLTDENLANQLKNSGIIYDLYASASEGLVTLNITLENLGLLYGLTLSEQDYVDMSIGQLPTALESMGFTDVTAESITLTFAGEEHAAIRLHAVYQGIDFYETLVCVKSGTYMACITAASYLENITTDVLAFFEACSKDTF